MSCLVGKVWNKKQKRAYHRAKSGVKVADILHAPVKHLVLTSSQDGFKRNISNDFQVLRKRIHRKFGVLLSYFMVHTNEGYGVLHVLYRSKKYLPQAWLSNQWADIHKSPIVYIKQVPDTDIARYVVTQYVANQGSSYQRCSWSQGWVCKGFVSRWKQLLRWYRDYRRRLHLTFVDLLVRWDGWLSLVAIRQFTLDDFG
jgi:hypothetical protein